MSRVRTFRSGFIVLLVMTAAGSLAQGSGALDSLKNDSTLDSFTAEIKQVESMKRHFFEVRDVPPPPTADQEVESKSVLTVSGNKARLDYYVGEGSSRTHYINIFDGARSLEYYEVKKLPNGKVVIRASEGQKNGIANPFWVAFNRDDSSLKYVWEFPSRYRESGRTGDSVMISRSDAGKHSLSYSLPPQMKIRSQDYTNPAGKISNRLVVEDRFEDGFPMALTFTQSSLGTLEQTINWTITKHSTGTVNDKLFQVDVGEGSFVTNDLEGWTYLIGADGTRNKFLRNGDSKPLSALDKASFALIALIGIVVTGLLYSIYRKTRVQNHKQ
jgi:hypothetical protein